MDTYRKDAVKSHPTLILARQSGVGEVPDVVAETHGCIHIAVHAHSTE